MDNLQIIRTKKFYNLFLKICYNLTSSITFIFFQKREKMDYEKYSKMNLRQLINAYTNAEKKEKKLIDDFQKKLDENKNLMEFLKTKIKESL